MARATVRQLAISSQAVQEVLHASRFLDLAALGSACCDAIEIRLVPSNTGDIYTHAETLGLNVLKEAAQRMLKDAGKVLNEDPFDLCDGGRNQNVPVPWVPHYLFAALEKLKKKGNISAHLK